jgi:dipeptidyl aminopeptidase/acylaminoacyl peptidase
MRRTLVFIIAEVVFLGTCFTQNANAQNANIEQEIIGTWVNNKDRTTWVFNANGTITVTGGMGGTVEVKYGVTDTKLAIMGNDTEFYVYSFSISSDGKTLIIFSLSNGTSGGIWLTKKNKE